MTLALSAAEARGGPVGTGPLPESAQPGHDDTLTLLLHCCDESLSAPSQIALTLRAVGGLSTG